MNFDQSNSILAISKFNDVNSFSALPPDFQAYLRPIATRGSGIGGYFNKSNVFIPN
jgi:hypothetical protein